MRPALSRSRRNSAPNRRSGADDPDAPQPNSLVVAASAVVADERGRILMQRRADSGLWAVPGGAMEITESLADAVVREVNEETGYRIEITGLVGLYTDPRHIIAYDNGEVRRQFNICFTARIVGGHLRASDESTEVRWIEPEALDEHPMHHTQRLRLRHYLQRRNEPYMG
ncbi:MAG: NUDIX domain-containing protein [Streptomycetales bacterium]